jgi:nicotinate-nucleotide adenylyltransferase
MNAGARVGLLGGTLDPIHVGHVETATAARRTLDLDRVDVLPSRVPPHRAQLPAASGYHRFAMTALAVNGVDGLAANDVELRAPGPSYTADTLTRFQDTTGLGPSQIFFITGADAFAEIETWHRFPEVLELANFVVISRPGFPVERLRARLPDLAIRMTSVGLKAGRQPPVSNRRGIFLVDAPTPDVSSTEIRRRLAAGEPLTGLVAAAVAQHIVQHGLYAAGVGLPAADHLHDEN